ncbi:MAG: hypothetical protein JWO03_2924 [Bacteroidetes bacterium]|nr:hypothetical protein [Bacteroidota bacterium]
MKNYTLFRILLICTLCIAMSTARAQYVAIPDTNFGNWLYNNGYAPALTGNSVSGWQLNGSDPSVRNATMIDCHYSNIHDLEGIGAFINVKYVNCSQNYLTTIPYLPYYLDSFNCEFNQISSFNTSFWPVYLQVIRCNLNNLHSMLPFPTDLRELYCQDNPALHSLPSLPSTLTILNCSYDSLTAVPVLPASIRVLNCNSNQLTSLPAMPNELAELYCSFNPLGSLPGTLPDSLQVLECGYNGLSTLSALPDPLYSLSCGYNNLTTLPTVPPGMQYLSCDHNPITSLPALVGLYNLIYLICNNAQLTSLPSLPGTLQQLDCSHNMITSLAGVSATSLNCSYNRLTTLTTPYAYILDCSHNMITTLSSANPFLRELYCNDNQISVLPSLPASIISLTCSNNPSLSCLPRITRNQLNLLNIKGTNISCLPNRFSSHVCDTILANYPLCDATSGCEFYYNISGNIHYDNSPNCLNDSLNPGVPVTGMKVQLKQGGSVVQQFYTFTSGGYSFKTPSLSTYTVSIDTTSLPLSVICPGSGARTVSLTAIDSVHMYENFGMRCSSVDFGVIDIASAHLRPTFSSYVHINAGNISLLQYSTDCGAGTSGIITTTWTNAGQYSGPAAGALTPTSVSGHTLTYIVTDLDSIHEGSLDFIFTVDTGAVVGSQLCITTTVAVAPADAQPANDSRTECYTIVHSWDPNYKEVYPSRLLPANADWLTYTIHFQNTGSDTAYLVVLKDTLSQYVDAASFQYLASSHHAVVQLDHNVMTFTFPHINLVDSATNPALSEGWIQYRVKANPNLTDGTLINNTAFIYFDNNPAVVTNTATTNVTLVTCSDTTISLSQSICAGDTFTFYGQQLTAQGIYNDTMPRAGGCDSIISLTLAVHPKYIAPSTHDTICDGDVYAFHGQSLMVAGPYSATLQSVYGCDSIVSIILAVRPSDMTMLEDTICSGASYAFYGQSLTASGMYMDTLQNMHGCDSVIMLMLEVRASDTTRLADTICSGTSYLFYGRSLTAAGTYTDTLLNVHGCDSLIVLALAVRPAPVVSWTQSDTFYCVSDVGPPSFWLLTNAAPAGGIFAGGPISQDSLDISPYRDTIYVISYSYTDRHGCTASINKTFLFTVCPGVIESPMDKYIHLYPNPNSGVFTLQTSDNRNSEYIITDMLGNMIEDKAITSDSQAIDMSEAAAGVYTLTVKGIQSSHQVRFVVVR